jgi:hypothetical protein
MMPPTDFSRINGRARVRARPFSCAGSAASAPSRPFPREDHQVVAQCAEVVGPCCGDDRENWELPAGEWMGSFSQSPARARHDRAVGERHGLSQRHPESMTRNGVLEADLHRRPRERGSIANARCGSATWQDALRQTCLGPCSRVPWIPAFAGMTTMAN